MNKLFFIPFAVAVLGAFMYGNAATFNYSYDSLNRVTKVAYSDGSSESYSYDSAGNRLSQVSLAAVNRLDNSSPSTPTNLAYTAFSPSQISVIWNRSYDTGGSGLAGYKIYLNNSLIATTTSTNYTLSGLMPGSSYCLAVVAFDHYSNYSAQSFSLCTNTAPFLPPSLVPLGFTNQQFKIGISGGTIGPYNVWGSSNLITWQQKTNVVQVPLINGYFTAPDSATVSPYFYRLSWSTNAP